MNPILELLVFAVAFFGMFLTAFAVLFACSDKFRRDFLEDFKKG